MTPQQIVGVGVRLFAIWLGLAAFSYLVTIPKALLANNLANAEMLSYVLGGFYLLAALLLWFFPMSVAHKLVPRTRFDDVLRVPAVDAARVGCCLLGLWILGNSGPYLVSMLFRAYLVAGSGPFFGGLSPEAKVDFVAVLVQLAFALILIAASERIAGIMTSVSSSRKEG